MDNIGTSLLNACFVNRIKVGNGNSLHLGIFNQPFYAFIMSGDKTIESRFSINKCSPYGKAKKNDIVFIKETGKSICSYSIVSDVKYYSKEEKNLDLELLKANYSKEICAIDNNFWQDRINKNYASLLWITEPKTIIPFSIEKRDKRGWIDYKLQFPKTLILISGKIGSGKTYWADKIAKEFKCNRNSFSDYLKLCCIQAGLEINRENLQKIGQWVILNDFENFMNYTVLNNFNSKSDCLVIDGLRHVECIDYYNTIIKNVIHINLNPSENFRKVNIANRDGCYNSNFDNKDVENNFNELNKTADYIINEFTDEKSLFSFINNIKSCNNQLSLF